jgi:hypothetical protein
MALRDFTNQSDVVESIRPQTASGAVNGETVDMRGADSVLIAISAGAITGGNGDSSITLEESDDDSNWTDVADEDIIGTEPTLDPNTAYQFGYSGGARYVRAVFDLGTETDAAICATAVRSHLHREPIGQTVDSET